MKALTISDRENMILALKNEIGRNDESRYDHRLHALLLVAQGMSCAQAAQLLGDDPKAVAYWLIRFEEDGFAALIERGQPAKLETVQQTNFRFVERSDFCLASNIRELYDMHCTGCGACAAVCPAKCISLVENQEGFLFPQIGQGCLHCGECDKVCPIIHKPDEHKPLSAFAIKADDQTRFQSSSGGVFPVAGKYVLENNGYVCGAAFTDDFRHVQHKIISDSAELPSLCYSKYVQSDLRDSFPEIKELLQDGRLVLFSGCPCQVAGLRKYLGAEYENLITMGLICHGVPSPLAWTRWLDHALKGHTSPITSVCMRDKNIGWRGKLLLQLQDGTQIRETRNDLYNRSFLQDWNLRKSCYDCSFKNKRLARPEDITIGDFWGFEAFDRTLDDNKGVSLVLVNSKKGDDFLKSLHFDVVKEVPQALAKQANLLVPVSLPYKRRSIFFSTVRTDDYADVVRYCARDDISKIVENPCEAAVLGMYTNENIGGQLTVLAVYKIIEKLGYPVKIIRFSNHMQVLPPKRRLLWEHLCKFTTADSTTGREQIDRAFRSFVTTPDWTLHKAWNASSDCFFLQAWTSEDKNRISFAGSFGDGKGYIPEEYPILRHMLSRFSSLTVREPSGVEFCKSIGVENVAFMHDAVFALNKDFYVELSELGSKDRPGTESWGKYFSVYLRDFTGPKIDMIVKIAEQVNMQPLILIGYEHEKKYVERFHFSKRGINYVTDLTMCEWLYFINNSEAVLTDSFHATCFSLILNKPFVTMQRTNDGLLSKLSTLATNAEMPERLVNVDSANAADLTKLFRQSIDWSRINKLLKQWKVECSIFINDALKKG